MYMYLNMHLLILYVNLWSLPSSKLHKEHASVHLINCQMCNLHIALSVTSSLCHLQVTGVTFLLNCIKSPNKVICEIS